MVSQEPATVRFLRAGDEKALLEHLVATFGGWPGIDLSVPAIEHLRWKLGHDPAASECSVVAESGGRIVGALLFVGQRVRTRSGEWLAAHGADWSVQPAYQGLSLMIAMRTHAGQRLDQQADFNPGQSGHARIMKFHLSIGYSLVGNALQRFVVRLSDDGPLLRGATSITEVAEFDERADRLWAQTSQTFAYIGVRDRRWLNRRYCDKRAGDFTVLFAEEDGELLGYCVYRVSTRKTGNIADLLALPDRVDVIEALVDAALAAFRREGLATAECWLPGRHPYRAVIEAAGFAPRSKPVQTIYKALRAPEEAFAFLRDRDAALHITMGDSDVV